MNLIEKLKEYNGSLTVDHLDDELQKEVLEWALNYAEEYFSTEDEKLQIESEMLESRVWDVIELMENE